MRLDYDKLVREYYEKKIKQKYPEVTLGQTTKMSRFIFTFAKRVMGDNTLRGIRLKYFGIFTTYPGRVIGQYNRARKKFESGVLDEKRYLEIKESIEAHIERDPMKFKKKVKQLSEVEGLKKYAEIVKKKNK